ncbi:MAG: TetR/AcrR family transcriptional regulator [Polyangiaceae bacterium]|nr:TetR/AcrR family transcriptional regulator [Polyangiaceae bacterium]
MSKGKKREKAARTPSQERSRATVEAILEAAARILEREGLGRGFGTNRIAREAGVSVGSLYEYFESKDAIVKAMGERHVARVQGLIDQAFGALRQAPAEEAVGWVVDGLFLLHGERPDLQRVLQHEYFSRFGFDPFIATDRHLSARLVEWLAEQHPGAEREELEARAFVAVRAGRSVIIHTFVEGVKTDLRPRIRDVLVQALGGLLGRERQEVVATGERVQGAEEAKEL